MVVKLPLANRRESGSHGETRASSGLRIGAHLEEGVWGWAVLPF